MCCKYTLSLSVLFLPSVSSSSSSLYSSLSPVSHTVCYCITVTYILKKACLFLLHAWKCRVENINISGKKYENNNKDVAMNTNLNCKYLYEECFPSVFFFFLTFYCFFFGLFMGLMGDFLSSVSQCVAVSVNSLQCLSVRESMNLIFQLRF